MPAPEPPAPPSPPEKQAPGKRKAFLVTAVALTMVIVVLLAAYPYLLPEPQLPGESPPETFLGLSVNQTSPGNWTIYITAGSYKASSVRLTVVDPHTGETTLNKVVSKLAPAQNDPDAVYNNNFAISNLDAGDTIVLKASGGHIIAGYKVQFLQGRDLIGTIRDLPAEIG
jgi:hypothetical protein